MATLRTGSVDGVAATVTVAGVVVAVLLLISGFILDAIRKGRHDNGRANYMRYDAVRDTARSRPVTVPTQRRFARRPRSEEVEVLEIHVDPRDDARAV